MRMTLRQMEAFYWTATLGSVHAAAEHLNFSQPAVSARIKELESALNVELFTRKNQRMKLTDGGRNAVAYAQRVLGAAQEFERLGHGGPALEGRLRLGSDESTAMVALTDILTRLKRMHPRLLVELTIDVGAVLKEKLRKREIDIALHTSASAVLHVFDEQLGWVDFQWFAGRDVDVPAGPFVPAVATKLPIVTNSPPSTLNAAVRQWLRSDGLDFDAVNSCNSLSLMLRLVRTGHAIAVLPTPVLREQLASGEVRCLPAHPRIPPIAYYASYVKDGSGRDVSLVVDIAKAVLSDAGFFTAAPSAAQPAL